MKTRDFKECLPMLRIAFSIMLIFSFIDPNFLLRIWYGKYTGDSQTEQAAYQAADAFEPGAAEGTLEGGVSAGGEEGEAGLLGD
jgi:hypothetical protein